jgi:uncharacterized C2H2 Zn-finger protein
MPSPSPLYSRAAEYLPTMALSPFAFEEDLNIGFRKILEGQSYPEFSKISREAPSIHPIPSSPCPGASERVDPSALVIDGEQAAAPASTPNTSSTPSTPSTEGTDSCSNASQSPTPSSSVDFTFTPSRSSSPTMTRSTNSYPCSRCNEMFRLRGELNKHWNRKHEKRFSCAVQGCDQAFHLRADLIRHTKTHDVQADITCDYDGCSRTFSREDNMKRHVREAHKHGRRKRAGSG